MEKKRNHNLVIRSAEMNDAESISKVLLDFYNMNNEKEARNVFLSEIEKDYQYLVAENNGKIIGLVTWLTHGLLKHGLFELDRICLLKDSRGMGLGKQLVDALISDARKFYVLQNQNIRKLYLLTHEENKNAQKFYEKVGFKYETTLKDHYYKQKNELVYSIFFN